MSIEIRGLHKRFGAVKALEGIDLDVGDGELLALLGPSGCGKTTLLRSIAGLEIPDRGTIRLSGEDVSMAPARARGVGFVFQHYALFRHMSVAENVAFGLRVRPRQARPAPAAIEAAVQRVLDLVQLDGLARRYPDQLSGGQRQRVALARALVIEPRVLLLDEPFGALDAQVRRDLRRWLRRLHDDVGITSVFVTHDQEEALEVADRIVVLNHGRIEQAGPAQQLYDHPVSAFVCSFLGETNRLRGTLQRGWVHVGSASWPVPDGCALRDGVVDVCVRPHRFRLAGAGLDHALAAHVVALRPWGGRVRLEARGTGADDVLVVDLPETAAPVLSVGTRIHLVPEEIRLFAA